MFTVVGYKRFRREKDAREIERIAYPSEKIASRVADAWLATDHYDRITIENGAGEVVRTYERHDRSNGHYQTGF